MSEKKGAKKPNSENVQAVEILMEKLEQFPNMILTNYQGLSVSDVTKLRKQLREAGATYVVSKNTLIKIALNNRNNTDLDGFLFGPTAVALAGEEIVAVAKVLKKFQKEAEALQIKGGYAEGQTLDQDGVMRLADLPSKPEALSKLMGTLLGPVTKLASGMKDVAGRLVRTLDARARQLGGES